MTIFYSRYCELCAKANKSVSGVAAAIGLSNAAASGWKNGKIPSDTTLAKLSGYFGVSVGYLKGETDQKEKSPTGKIGEADYSDDILLSAFKSADKDTQELIRRVLGLK